MTETLAGVTAPGFAEPVHDAQIVFRAALTALSEPGRVIALPDEIVAGLPSGQPVGPAALALLLALADGDTPLWLDGPAGTAADFLRFHTGASIAAEPSAARFALVADAAACPRLDRFALGDETYPDRSATVILEAAGLSAPGPLGLSGPGIDAGIDVGIDVGIEGRRSLAIAGLARHFLADWAANHALFPRGVDILVTCGGRLCGLPRSVRLEGSCT